MGRLLIEDWATKAEDSSFLGQEARNGGHRFLSYLMQAGLCEREVDIRICVRKGQLAREILRRKEHVTTKIQPSGSLPRAIEVVNLRIDHSEHSSSFCMAGFNRMGSS